MRLLYLMTEPFGIGGVQSDILALSEDLVGRGHEIYVATTPGILLNELESCGAWFFEVDFHYTDVKGFMKAALALRRIIKTERIEIVAPQSVRSTLVGYFGLRALPFGYRVAATGRRPPIITTIHNIHNPTHFRYGGYLLNWCSDFVIFESHYERDRLLASGLSNAKSTVVHSGIDTGRFKPLIPDPELARRYGIDREKHRVFGIIARLSEEKGHDYLLEAFACVNREHPDTRLLIIGDGPLLAEVRAKATGLGLNNAVVFAGLQRNIPEHLAIIDVFVLSSTRESFPLAAREAMAAGKAVIAPRIGGCPEVVADGETGFLFPVRNVAELADRMRQILDKEIYVQQGQNARARVERLFSRKQWVDGDESIYLRWSRA